MAVVVVLRQVVFIGVGAVGEWFTEVEGGTTVYSSNDVSSVLFAEPVSLSPCTQVGSGTCSGPSVV